MTKEIYTDVARRHDFVIFFDVTNGNPNGDPDAGNLPRLDPETMQGFVTDVCLKRKVRNYIDVKKGTQEKYKIFVENRGYLVDKKERAYKAVGAERGDDKKIDEAQAWMCQNFYDIRAFGAVLVGKKGEGYNCGQVRGPVQMTFARSVDPIVPMDIAITRVALENRGDKPRESEDEKATTGTIGRKSIVPYGLYVGYGFINPFFAEKTGFSSEDLALFWEALQNMWDIDRSASRGFMAIRGLYVFSHENKLGNAPANELFDKVKAVKKSDIESPRNFGDYLVSVDDKNLPPGITLTRLVG